jgi:hypothetical protein
MTMRTPLPPLLTLLTPILAFAQAGVPQQGPVENQVSSSPLFWYWVALLAVAAVVFAWVSVRLSRRRRGPPPPGSRTGTRTPRTPRPV